MISKIEHETNTTNNPKKTKSHVTFTKIVTTYKNVNLTVNIVVHCTKSNLIIFRSVVIR